MAKPNDLTPDAIAGYRGDPNPRLQTSPAWYAHELGAYLLRSGRSEPSDVRMSRGASIRCRDMLYRIDDRKAPLAFDRVI